MRSAEGIDLYLLADALEALCHENGVDATDSDIDRLTRLVAGELDAIIQDDMEDTVRPEQIAGKGLTAPE